MRYDILVTGGAGYLGSTLVPHLLQAGHRVTVLDNFLFRQSSLNHVCHDPNFQVVKGDIRTESVVAPLLRSNTNRSLLLLMSVCPVTRSVALLEYSTQLLSALKATPNAWE